MNILGISFGHGDSSAALIQNGQLIAAVEEERFTRIKHEALFPKNAILSCLELGNLSPDQVDVVAIPKRPWNAFLKKVALVASHPNLIQRKHPKQKISVPQELDALKIHPKQIKTFEHHLAHMASSVLLNPKKNSALLSIDGLGDFVSSSMGILLDGRISLLERIYFPNSLGFFYTAMTQYLGFPYFGDEFKVMGLSSHGQPSFLKEMREIIRTEEGFRFSLNEEALPILKHSIPFYLKGSQPIVDKFYNTGFITQLTGLPPRRPEAPLTSAHADLAKSVQMRFEEVANHLLKALENKIDTNRLCLSGGCAHNSVWVGKIPQNSKFETIHVAPAAGDAGIAIGAALLASPEMAKPKKHWALLGPKPKPSITIPDSVSKKKFSSQKDLIQWAVSEICDQKIIAVCRGKMEFGPRALGNRSILCDPRSPKMKNLLNERVKHRESFRPFAASVLADHEIQWFESPFDCQSMEAVFMVKKEKRNLIPTVVHADHSCRIHSVHRNFQPFFYDLIETFYKRTGVPLLVNTSFNDREPIVCSEDDAIRCFLATEIDHLILDSVVLSQLSTQRRVDPSVGKTKITSPSTKHQVI